MTWMTMLQDKQELNHWHSRSDPWGYESNPDDRTRKEILLSEIPDRLYSRVLDIGCGQGFITRDLPGASILGVDVSEEAIMRARQGAPDHISYIASDLFDLPKHLAGQKFDLIIITGVLYPQYIGDGDCLVKMILDSLLEERGVLVSVHVADWYKTRFPYLIVGDCTYLYRDYRHVLEVYSK